MNHTNEIKPIDHIAIIADGNRRWAKKRGLAPMLGHKAGADVDRLMKLLQVCQEQNIKYVTMWVFSTENWKRPKEEVDFIMKLGLQGITDSIELFKKYNMRFLMLGNKSGLAKDVVAGIEKIEELTKSNTGLTFQLAINYGGKDEIVRIVNEILAANIEHITEADINKMINKNNIPDPDMIIRTGGENRLSGFMLYNSGYSELFFPKILFPDFGPEELKACIDEYYTRNRRYGK